MLVVGLPQGVQLLAKFLEQQCCVYRVSCGGKFPINIDAIEDSRRRNSGREITVDEQIDATGDHGLTARSGTRSGRKAVGPRERDLHFQIWMQLLELLQRGEIPVQRAGVWRAANTWKIRILIVGPAIRYGAAGRRGVAEGVRQMRELIRNAIGLQIGNVVAGEINTPFFEVAA